MRVKGQRVPSDFLSSFDFSLLDVVIFSFKFLDFLILRFFDISIFRLFDIQIL